MPSATADLEIDVDRQPDGSCKVELRYRAPRSATDTNLSCDLPPGGFDTQQLAESELDEREYGRRLTAMLFSDVRLRKGFARAVAAARDSQTQLRIRMRLDERDEGLNGLRWELLQDPDDEELGFLVTSERTRFSRYPHSDDMETVVLPPRKDLDAVVAIANPSNLGDYKLAPIDVAGELERGQRALSGIKTTILARGDGRPVASMNAIVTALRDGPEVLYLVCHGTFHKGDSLLWLEGEDGAIERISGADFVQRIKELAQRPLLIVLAACESGSALAAIGPQLATAGIAAVVAMQGSIRQETIARFMPVFFAEIRRDGQIDRAMAAARGQVREMPDWWMPVLFMRVADGMLWSAPETSRGFSRPQQIAAAVVGLVVLIAASLLIYVNARPFFATAPPMTGPFNIAVSEFGMLDANNRARQSPDGLTLANNVWQELDGELKQLGAGIELRPPTDTGRADSDNAAQKLASDINADVLVYGNLTADGTSFAPQVIVGGKKLRDAEELAGSYQLGEPLRSAEPIPSNTRVLSATIAQLRTRSEALTQFVLGLNDYVFDDYAAARTRFEAAERMGGFGTPQGTLLLYLFLGNTAGKLGQYDAAEGYYQRALQADPQSARAQIGAAEVRFQRARGSCNNDGATDANGLTQAEQGFQQALVAKNQPAAADIPVKVDFALGRVYLCQSNAQIADRWADAEAAFHRVIKAFDSGNRDVLDRAAEAHANIGLIYLTTLPPGADAHARDQQAASEYDMAISLLNDDTSLKQEFPPLLALKGGYLLNLGFVRNRLQQPDEARTAYGDAAASYQRAAELSTDRPELQASYLRGAGRSYGFLKQYDQAEAAYAAAIKLAPGNQLYVTERDQLRKARAGG